MFNHNKTQSIINFKFKRKPNFNRKPLEFGDLEINFERTSWEKETQKLRIHTLMKTNSKN